MCAELLEMVILAILALPGQCGRVQSLSERRWRKVWLDLGMVLVRAGLKEPQTAFTAYGCCMSGDIISEDPQSLAMATIFLLKHIIPL